jgi:2-polyprenyl-3-methyl-5-hydroxy-6-metoxy-1,4-benzoquinol methylase
MTTAISADTSAGALAERLFGSALGALDLFCVYVGDRLGLYRVLAEAGPSTVEELADAAGVNARYAREWLEQQAMSGVLEVVELSGTDAERRYALPSGHQEVLLSQDSPYYMAPMAQLLVAGVQPIHSVLKAFRTGQGVPYADYGLDMRQGQERFTRPLFDNLLAAEWFPALPAIHDRLLADPPARVADLACGLGRSSVAVARAYPRVRVDGIDLDRASIEQAQELLKGSGLEDRVEFSCRDAADSRLSGRYDLVTMFEALHDLAHPVDVLRSARKLLSPGGNMLVADERTAEHFALDAGDVERLYYGMSVLHCLPVGMVGDDAAGTGTVIREETVRRYAGEAGFAQCDVAPIENDFWRFYLLMR